mgnify:CR=1 FL=1
MRGDVHEETTADAPAASAPPPAAGEAPTPVIALSPEIRPSAPPPTPPTTVRATAGLPIIKLSPETAVHREPDSPPSPAAPVPIPDHQNLSDHLIWMKPDPADWPQVQTLFPDISAETRILVDRRFGNYPIRPGDLVIVDDAAGAGIVPVQPEQPPMATRYPSPIFLGKIEHPPPPNQIARAQGADHGKGSVKLSPDQERPLYADDIIGIVIGIWVGLKGPQRVPGAVE